MDSIVKAVRVLGFRDFGAYVSARADRPLIEMADELGVNRASFLSYHAQWVDEHHEESDLDALEG